MEEEKLSLVELGKMMQEVFRTFRKRSNEQPVAEVKITNEQFGLLHAISIKEEEVIQNDMAEMMGKDKSSILRLIDSLEEKDLVRRVVDLKDRRKNCLMVTKLGYRVLDQYMKIFNDLMADIQQGLSPADIITFHRVVAHILNRAQNI